MQDTATRESGRNVARKLGIAKDVVSLGGSGTSLGFGVARGLTNFGFGVASACLQKPADWMEQAAGPNALSTGLKGVDGVVGIAHKVTIGCQGLAETITHASLDATKNGLTAIGAEDKALWKAAAGDEMAEAVALVEVIVHRYTQEMINVPPTTLLAAASAWGAMQQAVYHAQEIEQEVVGLPEHSQRWMRYAAATMGTAWFAGLVEGLSAPALARAQARREQGGGPGDCALACAGVDGHIEVVKFEEGTKELFAPGYLVAVDHEVNCIVVSLRGTCSITDALTDLVCEPESIQLGGQDGTAHGGMLRAAQRLDRTIAELTAMSLERIHPEAPRRIIVCGHSLGAGVGALLAALWRDAAQFPGVDVQCFAFACPQVLNRDLAVAQSNHTTSMIVGRDLVPRFSLATAQDLQAAMLCLVDPQSRGLPLSMRMEAILSAKARGDSESLQAAYHAMRPLVCTSPGRLFPAGRLIHLRPGKAPCSISCQDLDELHLSSDMASSHMPRAYLLAIQNASA